MVGKEVKNDSKSKLLDVISLLDKNGGSGVTEVADSLGIAKSTAHYHLDKLEQNDFVIKNGVEYKLGTKFLGIGFQTRRRIPLYEAAKDEVRNLARKTGELVLLATEEQGLLVFLDKAGGSDALDIDAPIGRTATLHNRALGKAMLAHFLEEKVDRILETRGLPETTDQTITTRDQLKEELEGIRDRGVAFNRREHIEGIHGVAVPILDAAGNVLGAMSVAGPSDRLSGSTLTDDYPYLLSKTRNTIELEFEHSNNK